jgi:putative MATE family efflux protein
LTSGSIVKVAREFDREILRLAIPALGSLIAEPLYILADTAVVGHLGTPQLGGLAVASTILLTGYSVFVFLAYGTTGAVARLIGAGDEREAAHQGVQGLWLAALLSVPLAIATAIWAGPLVRLIGADGDVAVNAEIYLRLSAPGIPALLLALAGTGYIRGLQDTRTPLLVAVGTSLLNVALEVLFVYGLDLGIGASAVATVIAQWSGAVVYLAVIGRSVRRRGVALRPDRRSLARLSRAGRDLVIRTAALRGALMIAVVVATEIGDVDLGAFQVAFQIWNLLALVLDAIAIAGQSMVAKSLGAGDAGAARAMARRMIEWSVVSGLVLAGLVVAIRPLAPQVFSDDQAVIALAGFMLWHVAALQPAAAVVFALDGVLIGAGDYRFLAWAMVGAFAAFGAASVAVLALDLGAGWLMGTLWVLMLARLGPLFARFRQDRWLVTGAAAA